MYSWLLVLVVLMAGGGQGGKRRRSTGKKPVEQPEREEDSDYNPDEDSGPESERIRTELRTKKREQDKGKGKMTDKGKGKGKAAESVGYARGQRQTIGVSIREPTTGSPPEQDIPVAPSRRNMYSSKRCVGERAVGVANLFEKVPGFQALFEVGNLHEICDFPERTEYGLELIREFYMRAGDLIESDGGPYEFITSVRGVRMSITPETIGEVLEMPARTDGADYMTAGFDSRDDWKRVLNTICVPEAEDNGGAILSKDLRLEYRFINFVVCYNVMPLANTKVIRWDRVLYMYLLGHPDIIKERNINLNVPFLIWKRMAREIKTSSKKDRLPFPLIIMRILRLNDVNVVCSSYERCLGPISDTTMAKSHVQLHPNSPPQAQAPAPPSPPTGGSEASISTVYREQQRLSGELARLTQEQAKLTKKVGRMSRLLRILCNKLGCGSSELPPPGSDSD